MLEAVTESVAVVIRRSPISHDASDRMVLEVAINGGADAIVTNNTKHFRDVVGRLHLQVLLPRGTGQASERRCLNPPRIRWEAMIVKGHRLIPKLCL
jgi:hypothetical protein